MNRGPARWGRLGLACALAAAGCARTGFPEGGPEDRVAPEVVATFPEDRAIDVPADVQIEILYDEPLAPGIQAQAQRLVLFNPDRPEVVTNLGGKKIEIQPREPLEPRTTYSVTVLPGLIDRRNNRTQEPLRVLFSTGGPLTLTLVKGAVTQEGRPVAGATVRALNVERQLGYTALTDSTGAFELPSVALGAYQVTAWNETNGTEGFQFTLEPGDTSSFEVARPGTGADLAFALTVTDTSAARPVRAEPIARNALAVGFSDTLDLATPLAASAVDLLTLGPEVAPRGTPLDSVPQASVRGERVPVEAARVDSVDTKTVLVELAAPLADSTAYAVRARGLRNKAGLVTGDDPAWFLFRTRQVPDSSLAEPPPPGEAPAAGPEGEPAEGAPPDTLPQPELGPGAPMPEDRIEPEPDDDASAEEAPAEVAPPAAPPPERRAEPSPEPEASS